MLLTIKQPAHHGYKSFHDYTPPTPPSTSRFSPAVTTGPSFPPLPATNKSLPPLSATTSTQKSTTTHSMSTPHRGLPPPAAMTLSQPPQGAASSSQPLAQGSLSQQLMGQLPAPPQQWQGAEESMRNWLQAKAEEDKRKQEEEKTRQEALRLEQRKIEQDMLRTSLSGGIPPYMIPMVFAGMGGGNLPNASLEWAQHYMAQAHHLQAQQVQPLQPVQQQQLLPSQAHSSPEQLQRRDSRAHQHPMPMTVPSTPAGPQGSQQVVGYVPNYKLSPRTRQSQVQGSLRQSKTGHLPRLNTGEMLIQPPPSGPTMHVLPGQSHHPLQQTQSAQLEPQSSPSIYFHHWQPPTTQANASSSTTVNQPTTPSESTSSPRKRKATGPQQAAPPPTSQPQYTSPSFSQGGSSVSNTPSSKKHSHTRQRSDVSTARVTGNGQDYRPGSRQRHAESSYSAGSPASQNQGHSHASGEQQGVSTSADSRPSGSNPVSSILEHSDSRPQSQQQQQQYRFSAGSEMRSQEHRRTPERKRSHE